MNWWVVSLFRNIRTSAVGPMNIVSCHPYMDFIFKKINFFSSGSSSRPCLIRTTVLKSVPWIRSCRSTFLSHMMIFEGSIGSSILEFYVLYYIWNIIIPCINKSGQTSEHFRRTSRQCNLPIIFVGGPSADWWIWWRWWIYLMVCFRTWHSIIDISMNHRQARHWRGFRQPWHNWLVQHWFNFFPRYINSLPPIIGKVQFDWINFKSFGPFE